MNNNNISGNFKNLLFVNMFLNIVSESYKKYINPSSDFHLTFPSAYDDFLFFQDIFKQPILTRLEEILEGNRYIYCRDIRAGRTFLIVIENNEIISQIYTDDNCDLSEHEKGYFKEFAKVNELKFGFCMEEN